MPEGGAKNAILWKITAILNWDTFIHYVLEDASGTSYWDMWPRKVWWSASSKQRTWARKRLWPNWKYWPISCLKEAISVKENLSKDRRFQNAVLKQVSPKYEGQRVDRRSSRDV
jgi:hypothetical protein